MRAGRFGAYVNWGRVNATLPKSTPPESVTLSEALELIAEREGAPSKAPRKTPAKAAKRAAKSTPAKTAAAAKANAPAAKSAAKSAAKPKPAPAAKRRTK